MEGFSKYCMISMCIVVFVVLTTVPNLTTADAVPMSHILAEKEYSDILAVPEFPPGVDRGSKKCPPSRNIALTEKQERQIKQAKKSGLIEQLRCTKALYRHTKPIVTDFTDVQKNAIACKYGEMIQATKKIQSRRTRDPTARICPAHDIQDLLVFALNTNNDVVQVVQIWPDFEQFVIQQPCHGNDSPHVQTTTTGSPIQCIPEYRAVPVVAVQLTNDAVTGIDIEFIEVESCTAIFDV